MASPVSEPNRDGAGAATNRERAFVRNLAARLGLFACQVVAAFWFTRYLVDRLGVEEYGFVPLVHSLTKYVAILTLALAAPLGRFLAMALAKGDSAAANRSFNSGLGLMLGLAGVLLIPVLVASGLAPSFLDMPEGLGWSVRLLFVAALGMLLFRGALTPFEASAFARNRLDLLSWQEVTDLALRIAFAAVLIELLGLGLTAVAAGIAFGMLLRGALTFWHWRRLTPEVHLRLGDFDRRDAKQQGRMGWHLCVNRVGAVLFLNVDLMVANLMLGAESAGRYGAILQVSMMLRVLAATAASVMTPTVVGYHAKGDTASIARVSARAVKWLGLLMAIGIGTVCAFARPLLRLWLGAGFEGYAWVLVVSVVHLCVTLAVNPLFGVQMALNRVRLPAMVTLGMGVVNLCLVVLVASPTVGGGLIGIAAVGGVLLAAKNSVFTPLYAASILGEKRRTFLLAMVPPLLMAGATWLCGAVVVWVLPAESWATLFAATTVTGLVGLAGVWFIALSRAERAWIVRVARSGWRKS
jgi:membrane protein EpsK